MYFFVINVLLRIEIADFRPEFRREIAIDEGGQPGDARAALDQILPERIGPDADRRDDADPCHHDPR